MCRTVNSPIQWLAGHHKPYSFRLVGMSIECQKQVSLGSTPFHAFTHLSGEPGSWDYRPIEEPTDEG